MSTTDPVGTALWSIGAGSTSGAVAITVAMLILRTVQGDGAGPANAATGAGITLAGLAVGLTLAVSVGWTWSRAIDDLWRRGVIGALSMFGASLLSLVTLPVDMLAGRPGLATFAALLLFAALLASNAARRAGTR